MFSLRMQMFRARKSSGLQAPSRARSRLCLESLEERALLNGGPLLSVASGSSGGPPAPLVGIVDSNGGTPGGSASSGGSGTSVISGPGYPIAPTSGPARPDSGTLTVQDQTTTFIPISGSPGGSGTTLTSVPVCLGSSTGPTSI